MQQTCKNGARDLPSDKKIGRDGQKEIHREGMTFEKEADIRRRCSRGHDIGHNGKERIKYYTCRDTFQNYTFVPDTFYYYITKTVVLLGCSMKDNTVWQLSAMTKAIT